MTKKIELPELAEFDPSKYLDDDEAIADYIRLAIEDGDPGLLAAALGNVARARGMTQVAQSAGLTREALYKASKVSSGISSVPTFFIGERAAEARIQKTCQGRAL